MSKKEYLVYWARLISHTDKNKQGYVGITINLDKRVKSHLKIVKRKIKQKDKLIHFHNALKKYKDQIIWEILHNNLSIEEALNWERIYRPKVNIGWNNDVGGNLGVSAEWYKNEENLTDFKRKTSEATKIGIQINDSTDKRILRAKEIWKRPDYKKKMSTLFSGENNPQFGKFGLDHPAYGNKHTQETKRKLSEANQGKKLPEETKKKISVTRIKKFASQKAARLAKIEKDKKEKKIQKAVDKKAGKFKGEKGNPSKVTDIQRIEICKLRVEGKTYNEIAKSYPIVLTSVRAIVETWGPLNGFEFIKQIGKSDLKKVTSDQNKLRICKAYSSGSSAKEIAKHFSLCEQTIYNFISKWGPKNGIPYIKRRKKTNCKF